MVPASRPRLRPTAAADAERDRGGVARAAVDVLVVVGAPGRVVDLDVVVAVGVIDGVEGALDVPGLRRDFVGPGGARHVHDSERAGVDPCDGRLERGDPRLERRRRHPDRQAPAEPTGPVSPFGPAGPLASASPLSSFSASRPGRPSRSTTPSARRSCRVVGDAGLAVRRVDAGRDDRRRLGLGDLGSREATGERHDQRGATEGARDLAAHRLVLEQQATTELRVRACADVPTRLGGRRPCAARGRRALGWGGCSPRGSCR